MPQWYGSPAVWHTASFTRNGTPANGPVGCGRFGPGALEPAVDHRVEARVDALDARDRGVDELAAPRRCRSRRARPGRWRRAGRVRRSRTRSVGGARDCRDGRFRNQRRRQLRRRGPHARRHARARDRAGVLLARVSRRVRAARLRAEPGSFGNGVAAPDGPAYFTSRGSLLGQVEPEVVASAFGVFKPAVVVPGVRFGWTLTDAPTIFAARRAGAVAQLERVCGPAGAEVDARGGVARTRGRAARRARPSAVRGPARAVGRSGRPVDAPVPPRRHAARVPRRRARVRVVERGRRRDRDRPAHRGVHGPAVAHLHPHARAGTTPSSTARSRRLRDRGLARRRRRAHRRRAQPPARPSSGRPTAR